MPITIGNNNNYRPAFKGTELTPEKAQVYAKYKGQGMHMDLLTGRLMPEELLEKFGIEKPSTQIIQNLEQRQNAVTSRLNGIISETGGDLNSRIKEAYGIIAPHVLNTEEYSDVYESAQKIKTGEDFLAVQAKANALAMKTVNEDRVISSTAFDTLVEKFNNVISGGFENAQQKARGVDKIYQDELHYMQDMNVIGNDKVRYKIRTSLESQKQNFEGFSANINKMVDNYSKNATEMMEGFIGNQKYVMEFVTNFPSIMAKIFLKIAK